MNVETLTASRNLGQLGQTLYFLKSSFLLLTEDELGLSLIDHK